MPLTLGDFITLDRLGLEIAELQLQARLLRYQLELRAGFKPDQPRVPAGNPDGGQWSGGSGGGIKPASEAEAEPGTGHNSKPSGIDQNFDDQSVPAEPSVAPNDLRDDLAARVVQSLIAGGALPAALGGAVVVGLTSPTGSDDTIDLARYAAERAKQLQAELPKESRGYVTVGVGILEDSSGNRFPIIATSEDGEYRRGITLRAGEIMIGGIGHAEAKIVDYANQNGYRVLTVGAGWSICPTCAERLDTVGAVPATRLRVDLIK